jgi:hypothetical protein
MVKNVAPWLKDYEKKAYLMYRRLLTSNKVLPRDMVQYCVKNTIGFVDYKVIETVVEDLKKRNENG